MLSTMFLALALSAPWNTSLGLGTAPQADCAPSWLPSIGVQPGTDEPIRALAVFDDGTGTRLYAGGKFSFAGSAQASLVASWDGVQWSGLGSGLTGNNLAEVLALCAFDDGSGPALYVGGEFSGAPGVAGTGNLARWNGANWQSVGNGLNGEAAALVVFDAGSGSDLYVGGNFVLAGGLSVNRIARWDGSSWDSLGNGVNGSVQALAGFDDGSGPALYAAGSFTSASGVSASRIARWKAGAWSPLGTGLSGSARALLPFDDGSGSGLFVAGEFSSAGGVPGTPGIARWDGANWSGLAGGLTNFGPGVGIDTLAAFDSGSGPQLYAGGQFSSIGGFAAKRVARWDGSVWHRLGLGVDARVSALCAYTNSGAPVLCAGGEFTQAGDLGVLNSARWDGTDWGSLGTGPNAAVELLFSLDVGAGPSLYAGGAFKSLGGVPKTRGIARWNGATWEALGPGLQGTVHALATWGQGSAQALYAGGEFLTAGGGALNRIARWTGTTWVGVGGGMNQAVLALLAFDDGSGSALYAGGAFTTAGGQPANRIARWNGSAWTPVGGGFDDAVHALAVHADGSGQALFAGGAFTITQGQTVNHIARWNGTSWSNLGTGLNLPVHALLSYEDGVGKTLVIGGEFTLAGGVIASRIARWNGSAFQPMGLGLAGGPNPAVKTLAVFDDGSGPALHAGGNFTLTGIQPVARVARWSGSQWSALPGSIDGGPAPEVRTLAVATVGSAQELLIGGQFLKSPAGDSNLTRRRGCSLSDFELIPGCAGNPALLRALSPALQLGQAAAFELELVGGNSGLGLRYGGAPGIDVAGCGLPLVDLGELLLASPWFELGSAPALQGLSAFSLTPPYTPQLVGIQLALQGAHLESDPNPLLIRLSNALSTKIAP